MTPYQKIKLAEFFADALRATRDSEATALRAAESSETAHGLIRDAVAYLNARRLEEEAPARPERDPYYSIEIKLRPTTDEAGARWICSRGGEEGEQYPMQYDVDVWRDALRAGRAYAEKMGAPGRYILGRTREAYVMIPIDT